MPNLEVLVSPQDLIALRSIYSRQKYIEESFHVHIEANVCVQQFPRYLPISVQHWLTNISVSIDCFDMFGHIWKVFLRAFRHILDCGNHASIHGVMAKWSLWQLVQRHHIMFWTGFLSVKKKYMYCLRVLCLLRRAHSMSTETHKSSPSQVPTVLLTTALIVLWLSLQEGGPYTNCLFKNAAIFLCVDWSQ